MWSTGVFRVWGGSCGGRRSLRTEQCACREALLGGWIGDQRTFVKGRGPCVRATLTVRTNRSGRRFRTTRGPCCRVERGVLPAVSNLYGEFDPGSGRTLAVCLIHASRGTKPGWVTSPAETGERVSNTWVTCPGLRDNNGKPLLIPDYLCEPHGSQSKAPAVRDRPASYQLVGGVMAHQGVDG